MGVDFKIEQFNYPLPEEKIAKFPLKDRAKSKLLLWKNNKISHHIFEQAASLIPENSLLVFNDTKVIAARLLFRKYTGAEIEIFLLHPEIPTRDISASMTLRKTCVWSCMIGNKKKWKEGILSAHVGSTTLKASYYNRDQNFVELSWTGNETFTEIINKFGETPLPPYLKREPVKEDTERYQTVYSKYHGAVAAPTAGLHFTEAILDEVKLRNIEQEYLTLHVSAGTFKPVETSDFRDHEMHREQIIIKKKSLINLLNHCDRLIAVGTTSLRILESLYWYGVLLRKNEDTPFFISKDLPYITWEKEYSFHQALMHILQYMDKHELPKLQGETEIFIYPGYKIRTAKGLFTNFHLPKSTLLLLISTFTGDAWRNIYNEALNHNYRFLSYGDTSLLLR